MPPRTRRSAAVAAAQLVADMQKESDEEKDEDDDEEQVDVEADEDEEDEEDVEEDDDVEVDAEEAQSDDDVPLEVTPKQPRLKITLKLPANNGSSAGTATPDDAELDYAAFKRTPKRRAKAKVIEDVDIESEDPSSVSQSEDEQSIAEAPSRSTGTPSVSTSTKPMTTRQAVLASVVDPTHVSLNEGTRSKKQPLNETELALRREETARKRKNLSEKKLEDEKAETINRLLKKQSRPKNKRNNTLDERSPMPSVSGSRTPKMKAKPGEDGEDAIEGEADVDMDDAMDLIEQPEEVKPTMYRWTSSLRTDGEAGQVPVGVITFSVPDNALPIPAADDTQMVVDEEAEKIRKARGPGVCAVTGCGKPRKYRLPKDWTIGACDSAHLRVLAN